MATRVDALGQDQKMRHLLRLIAKGKLDQRTRLQLARRWSMTEQSISHLMSDALRIVRMSRGSWEDELDRKLQEFEADRRTALALKRPLQLKEGGVEWYNAPDCKAAIRATELYLQAIGAMVRKNIRKHPDGSLEDLKQRRDAARAAILDLDAVIEQQEAAKGDMH